MTTVALAGVATIVTDPHPAPPAPDAGTRGSALESGLHGGGADLVSAWIAGPPNVNVVVPPLTLSVLAPADGAVTARASAPMCARPRRRMAAPVSTAASASSSRRAAARIGAHAAAAWRIRVPSDG